MSKRKPLPPRVKRMNRQGRLASARTWLPTYTGKNILQGYCRHFAVDWRCAAIELAQLGVTLDPTYLAQRELTEREMIKTRKQRKQQREAIANEHWHPYTDAYTAYLAGDFAALHDLEQREAAFMARGLDSYNSESSSATRCSK